MSGWTSTSGGRLRCPVKTGRIDDSRAAFFLFFDFDRGHAPGAKVVSKTAWPGSIPGGPALYVPNGAAAAGAPLAIRRKVRPKFVTRTRVSPATVTAESVDCVR